MRSLIRSVYSVCSFREQRHNKRSSSEGSSQIVHALTHSRSLVVVPGGDVRVAHGCCGYRRPVQQGTGGSWLTTAAMMAGDVSRESYRSTPYTPTHVRARPRTPTHAVHILLPPTPNPQPPTPNPQHTSQPRKTGSATRSTTTSERLSAHGTNPRPCELVVQDLYQPSAP